MKQRRLGKTGLTVSEICLGTMTFGSMADEPTSLATEHGDECGQGEARWIVDPNVSR